MSAWGKFSGITFGALVSISVASAGDGSAHANSPNSFVLQGASAFNTTIVEPFGRVVEAETGLKLVVIPNKSNLGLRALLANKASLAMLSTGLENEVELLRASDPTLPYDRLRSFEIARTRAAFVVHPDNPVRNLSLDQVGRILTGEIRNWKEFGGPDLPIRVVAIHSGGGVLAAVEQRLLGKGHIAAPDAIRLQVGTQIITVVGQEPGAIGITQLRLAKVRNATELITDKPVEITLSLVSLDAPSADALAVIEAMRRESAAHP
jgi:phosphate transport system substrate-binding protein